jgi:membrane protease YdiL (CAAX protease family)
MRRARDGAWMFALLLLVVLSLTLALGYARWEPKLPAWWPQWIWSMVFLTALPEEAIFRGVAQHWLADRLGGTRRAGLGAAVVMGGVFGVAHVAGGWGYVVLATAAGIGYGWIYASTGSIAASIAAHAGLNTMHFLLFTYPALAAPG